MRIKSFTDSRRRSVKVRIGCTACNAALWERPIGSAPFERTIRLGAWGEWMKINSAPWSVKITKRLECPTCMTVTRFRRLDMA